MDENRLRQQVCQAAYQLWARQLITGGSGVVSVELHRRRFLVTPMNTRRSSLSPEDIVTVDMGGLNIQGTVSANIPEPLWQPHRSAYKSTMGGEIDLGAGKRRIIAAVALADPPVLMGMMRLLPGCDRAEFMRGRVRVPIVDGGDDRVISDALRDSPGVLIRDVGLLGTGDQLNAVLNWIERIDALAKAELACGGSGAPAPPRQLAAPEPDDATEQIDEIDDEAREQPARARD